MKAWTDYPFVILGDAPSQEAPIREIDVLSYDGDKYVTVEVEGHVAEIKAGYCYTKCDCAPGCPELIRIIFEKTTLMES